MILPELKIVLQCCKGKTAVGEAIIMLKQEISDSLHNPKYNIIVDFREFQVSTENIDTDSIILMVGFLKKLRITSKVAMLTSEPHQVIIAESLKRQCDEIHALTFETFSTLEAAISWVNSMNNYELIDRKLFELSQNTN